MPSISYELPAWLIPKGFDAHLERMASLQAMEMGAREQQQKREFALRTDQFRLQQQKANLDMAGQVMSNQMMSDEMEDNLAIQKVFPQWQQGNFDASPEGLKTVKGMTYADRLKTSIMSQNTLGQARIAMDKDATLVIEDDPYNAAMLSQFKPYSPDYAKALRGMVDTMKSKQEAAFARKQDVLFTNKLALEEQKDIAAETRAQVRAQNALDIATLRSQATVESATIRASTAAYHAQKWMSHAQWTTYKARLDAINAGSGKPETKHAAMDKVDREFGVGHSIDDERPLPTTIVPKKISTKAERDALPSGTPYIGPDGIQAIKQ